MKKTILILLILTVLQPGAFASEEVSPSTCIALKLGNTASFKINTLEQEKSDNAVNGELPIVLTTVEYCKGAPAKPLTAALSAGSTGLKWYTTATGGLGMPVAPTPSTAIAGITSYWVSQISSEAGIESDRAKIDVVVSEIPTAPVIGSTKPYCRGEASSVEDLTSKVTMSSGTTANWYTSFSSNTSSSLPTSPSTTAVGSISWFVSQALNGCEGPKAELKINVIEGPVFTVSTTEPTICGDKGQIILKGLTSEALYKVGFNSEEPVAFTASSAGDIILDLVAGRYSRITVDNLSCMAVDDRTYMITDPTAPAFTVFARQPLVCGGLGALVIKGLKNNTIYNVSYNDVIGQYFSSNGDSISMILPSGRYSNVKVKLYMCVKEDPATYLLVEPAIVPPVVLTSNFQYCENQVVNVNDISSKVQGEPGNRLRWYTSVDGAPSSQPMVNTSISGTQSLWVSQASDGGCESEKEQMQVDVLPETDAKCYNILSTAKPELVEQLVTVTPNPGNGNFIVQLPSFQTLSSVRVRTIAGAETENYYDATSGKVSLPKAEDGIYILEIKTDRGFYAKKVFVKK